MNLKSKVATVAAASIFAIGLGTSALASTATGDITQEITPNSDAGALSAALDESSQMEGVVFSLEPGLAYGTLVVNVTDGRGSNAGWGVSLSATDFKPKEGLVAKPLSASEFVYADNEGLTVTKGSGTGVTAASTGVTLNDPKIMLTAEEGTGTGIYTQDFGVELGIPGEQPVGTYQSTITVSIANGPGQ